MQPWAPAYTLYLGDEAVPTICLGGISCLEVSSLPPRAMLRTSSKPFSLAKRIPKSRLSMSDDQRSARMYQLGMTAPWLLLIAFGQHPITTASVSAKQTSMRNEVAMSAIQTSLAALQLGSALASKLPYISPIAGLLLQVLTMRDVRVIHISSDSPISDECVTRK